MKIHISTSIRLTLKYSEEQKCQPHPSSLARRANMSHYCALGLWKDCFWACEMETCCQYDSIQALADYFSLNSSLVKYHNCQNSSKVIVLWARCLRSHDCQSFQSMLEGRGACRGLLCCFSHSFINYAVKVTGSSQKNSSTHRRRCLEKCALEQTEAECLDSCNYNWPKQSVLIL